MHGKRHSVETPFITHIAICAVLGMVAGTSQAGIACTNVIEDFEHGERGFYTYGKYQTMRQPNGNMDLVFAIHAFKWQLERDEESSVFERSVGERGGLVRAREKVVASPLTARPHSGVN